MRYRVLLPIVVVVVAAIVVVAVVSSRKAATTSVAVAPVSPIEIKIPTTNSLNAADCYRKAAELVDRTTDADGTAVDRYEDGAIDAQARAFFERHAELIGWLRAGAAQPLCDWGDAPSDERVKSLNRYRQVASFGFASAQFLIHEKQFDAAADDLLAVIALGRRIGSDAILIKKLVEIGMETRAIDDLAGIVPQLSPDYRKALTRRFDSLPRSSTGREMLLAEAAYAKESAREGGGNVILLSMADGMEGFYMALGDAIEKSPAEFEKAVDAELAKIPLNTLAKIAGPSMKRARQPLAVAEAKRDLFLTALSYLENGQSAIDTSRDRFGNGPYQLTKTPGGFVISSALQSHDANVSLRVGRN